MNPGGTQPPSRVAGALLPFYPRGGAERQLRGGAQRTTAGNRPSSACASRMPAAGPFRALAHPCPTGREAGALFDPRPPLMTLQQRLWDGYNVCLMDPTLPSTEITALLGRGTSFEGKLCFEGRVRIDGKFQGEIQSDDVLIVGEGADIDAEIRVGTAIIKGGTLRGSVRAAQSIELYVPARVNGTLHSPEIFMDKGVQFSGSCTIAALEDADARAGG
jgi:cytoskeletal protein CcmA (bactofilin family)